MKRSLVLFLTLVCTVQQPLLAAGEISPILGPDTRLYLTDGTVVMGKLVRRDADLIIVSVNGRIHTFESTDINHMIDLNSMGTKARTITVTEFPYISFLGGAVAFGVISWLQFDRAGDRDKNAKINRDMQLFSQEKKLKDEANRARLYGWSTALFAAGSLGISIIPRKATRRIFPELSIDRRGNAHVMLTWVEAF